MDQDSSLLNCVDSLEIEFICFLGSYYITIIGVIHFATPGFFFLFFNLLLTFVCFSWVKTDILRAVLQKNNKKKIIINKIQPDLYKYKKV